MRGRSRVSKDRKSRKPTTPRFYQEVPTEDKTHSFEPLVNLEEALNYMIDQVAI